jgi:hypothetical protein
MKGMKMDMAGKSMKMKGEAKMMAKGMPEKEAGRAKHGAPAMAKMAAAGRARSARGK